MVFGRLDPLERDNAPCMQAIGRALLLCGFENSFRKHPDAYLNLLYSYIAEWSADIGHVVYPVENWRGDLAGDQDTWSPLSMARALCAAFPDGAKLNIVENGAHYSPLKQALI